MHIPTAHKAEAVLAMYAKKILWGLPTVTLLFFHERLAQALSQISIEELRTLSAALIIGLTIVASLFLFYLYRYHITRKALLTVKPDFFTEQEKDRLWEQVKNDRAREKNKT